MAHVPVFGPNDFHTVGGNLMPGLGPDEEAKIIALRGGAPIEEPPAKAELRRQGEELKAKAKQLSTIERELEKEKESMAAELQKREDDLAAREAVLEAQLKDLSK